MELSRQKGVYLLSISVNALFCWEVKSVWFKKVFQIKSMSLILYKKISHPGQYQVDWGQQIIFKLIASWNICWTSSMSCTDVWTGDLQLKLYLRPDVQDLGRLKKVGGGKGSTVIQVTFMFCNLFLKCSVFTWFLLSSMTGFVHTGFCEPQIELLIGEVSFSPNHYDSTVLVIFQLTAREKFPHYFLLSAMTGFVHYRLTFY